MTPPDNDQTSEQQTGSSSVDLVTQIIIAATDAVERYKQQLLLGKALAGREWRLSMRALVLVMAGVLLLVVVSSTIWITINVVLALSMFKLGIHWAWISTAMVLLNVGVLVGIVSTIRALLKQVSMGRSWSAITMNMQQSSVSGSGGE
ncbi:MAG: hypothetical protein ACJA13_003639 [Paraglaciecola sp.]|jgi:hypothetical protein